MFHQCGSQSRYAPVVGFTKEKRSLIRGGDDPHLHLGSGEYDKTEDVAEDPDGYDDESHHAGN